MKHQLKSLLKRPKGRAKMSRRAMLRGTGGALLSLPFLSTLERPVRAADPTSPCRLVSFYTPNGFDPDGRATSANLTGTTLEALTPFRDRVTTISGMSQESRKMDPESGDGAHYIGWAHCAVGDNAVPGSSAGRVAGAISYDQYVGSVISESWQSNVLVQGGPSWRGGNQPAFAAIYNPREVWAELFGGFMPPTSDEPEMMDAMAEQLRADGKSVLDYSMDSIKRLQCQLGAEDQKVLEQHFSDLRNLEARISMMPDATTGTSESCSVPTQPRDYPWPEPKDKAIYREWAELRVEMAVMGMACDLIRVASIGIAGPAGSEFPEDLGVNESHHELSHDRTPDGRSQVRIIDRYHAELFARMLSRMDSVTISEGTTLLDNAACLWLSEGGRSDGHDFKNLEFVVAGGRLKGGQHLQFEEGFAHNNLLLEIINAVVPESERIDCFGNQAVCGDGVPELRV